MNALWDGGSVILYLDSTALGDLFHAPVQWLRLSQTRLWQSWSTGTGYILSWLLNLVVSTWCWFGLSYTMQDWQGSGSLCQDFRNSQWGRECVVGKAAQSSWYVNLWIWVPSFPGDPRMLAKPETLNDLLPRKAAGTEQSWPMRDPTNTSNGRAAGLRCRSQQEIKW